MGATSALLARAAGAALALAAASACEPTVVVGTRMCSQSLEDSGPLLDPDSGVTPWQTGFEDGFCEYAYPTGFCFGTGSSMYTLVKSPVHSGQYAAAFSVRSDVDGGSQVRCVGQGIFPGAAYYGAWYYVPVAAQNTGVWNLFHFQGGVPGQVLHGLWDVSLVSLTDGGVRLNLYDFLSGTSADAGAVPPIPINQWFHIEVHFKRAKDATGEISMYQDGVLVARLTGLATDDTDWGQWYVGNLATALSPAASIVYVDDITLGPAPGP
jgi:hypothetical protein